MAGAVAVRWAFRQEPSRQCVIEGLDVRRQRLAKRVGNRSRHIAQRDGDAAPAATGAPLPHGLAGLGVDTALQAAPVLDAGIAALDLELHLQIKIGEHLLVVQVVLPEIDEVLGFQRLVPVDGAVLNIPLPRLAVPAV